MIQRVLMMKLFKSLIEHTVESAVSVDKYKCSKCPFHCSTNEELKTTKSFATQKDKSYKNLNMSFHFINSEHKFRRQWMHNSYEKITFIIRIIEKCNTFWNDWLTISWIEQIYFKIVILLQSSMRHCQECFAKIIEFCLICKWELP